MDPDFHMDGAWHKPYIWNILADQVHLSYKVSWVFHFLKKIHLDY